MTFGTAAPSRQIQTSLPNHSMSPPLVSLIVGCAALCVPARLDAAAPAKHATPVAASPATAHDARLPLANAKFEILLAAGLYTGWPAAVLEKAGSVITIGIVGSEPNTAQLRILASQRKIAGRQVVVQTFQNASEVENCQILLLASSLSKSDRKALIEKYRNSPVLLASSAPGFCQEGGGLGFLVDGGSVKFSLNSQTLARQKLVIDPRYSRLAKPLTTPAKPADKDIAKPAAKDAAQPAMKKIATPLPKKPAAQPHSGEHHP